MHEPINSFPLNLNILLLNKMEQFSVGPSTIIGTGLTRLNSEICQKPYNIYKMKLLVVVLGVFCLANSLDYYSNQMTFMGTYFNATQRLERGNNQTIFLCLNEINYLGNFGLTLKYNLTKKSDGIDYITIFGLINADWTKLVKITVRYVIMKDVPSLESILVNITKNSIDKYVKSKKGMVFNKDVSIVPYCIGFTNVILAGALNYSPLQLTSYFQIKSAKYNFTNNDWVMINFVIVDSSRKNGKDSCCQVLPTKKYTSQNQTKTEIAPSLDKDVIFGIQSMNSVTGNLQYDKKTFQIKVSENGVFNGRYIIITPGVFGGSVYREEKTQ